MMEKKDIVVVIPIYKATLTKYEEMSLNQCVKVLADYPLVVVKPVSLDINALLLRYSLLKVENFSNSCFAIISICLSFSWMRMCFVMNYWIGRDKGMIISVLRGYRNKWKVKWEIVNVFC